MASPNLSSELRLGSQWTTDLYWGGNFWTFGEEVRAKHWVVDPELRYWLCEAFNGTFVGVHALGGQFNVGGLQLPVGRLRALREHRYQGYFYGAGMSVGHQWLLSPRWSVELSLGGGWARAHYDRFDCAHCGGHLSSGVYDYFGVTRATLSFVYIIK